MHISYALSMQANSYGGAAAGYGYGGPVGAVGGGGGGGGVDSV